MTVNELIQKLQFYPPEMQVVTEGYEEGFDSIKSVSEIILVEAVKKEWYVGQYENPFPETDNGFKAVFLYAGTKEEKK